MGWGAGVCVWESRDGCVRGVKVGLGERKEGGRDAACVAVVMDWHGVASPSEQPSTSAFGFFNLNTPPTHSVSRRTTPQPSLPPPHSPAPP